MLTAQIEQGLSIAHPILLDVWKDFADGKIHAAELGVRCYYYTVDHILDGYRWRPLPSAPYAIQRYRQLGDHEKDQLSRDGKRKVVAVREMYEKQVREIHQANSAHLWWLYKCRDCFQSRGDEDYKAKVQELIYDHEQRQP